MVFGKCPPRRAAAAGEAKHARRLLSADVACIKTVIDFFTNTDSENIKWKKKKKKEYVEVKCRSVLFKIKFDVI